MPRHGGIPYSIEHISNWVNYNHTSSSALSILPAGLPNAGQLSTEGKSAEANAADAEFAHVSPGAPAKLAPVVLLDPVLGWSLGFDNL